MKLSRNMFASAAILAATLSGAVQADPQNGMIGINVLLNEPVDGVLLQGLSAHGEVLDVMPEINAVTLKVRSFELPAVQALPYVVAANADAEWGGSQAELLSIQDFVDGSNQWNLDAINRKAVGNPNAKNE
jgi:hypothetical protein